MPTKKQVPQTTTAVPTKPETTTPKVEEVKPQATAAAPAPKTEEPKASKQMLAVMTLTVALREQRQIEVKPDMVKQDGKYIVVRAGENWPEIYVGPTGGFNIPSVKSYPKADLATMLQADTLWQKQQAREQKKAAVAAPKAPAAQPAATA